MFRNFQSSFNSYIRDRRGNVAVIFALASVPLISFVGGAIDHGRAAMIRSKLQGALDSASIGAIVQKSTAFAAAGSMSADGDVPGGSTTAVNYFYANTSSMSGYTINSVTAKVSRTNGVVTSSMQFSADVPTTFSSIMGFPKLTVTGSATATATMPQFIDFYLLLDNSPSMGVGATPADVAVMVNNTPDKCAFACHDTANKSNYYDLAKKLGVTTRIDVLRSATQSLMDTAASTQTYPNQFRVAIYDFGGSASTASLRPLFSLSSSLSSAKTAAGAIDLMSVNGQNDNNDQDTQFSSVIPAIDKTIANTGNGTANAPAKYLFFVSDGVADEYNPSGCLKKTTGGRCQSPLDPSLCTALKNRGVKIAVLYTTYLDLPTNAWYNTWIAPFNKGPYGPSTNSEIAANMQSCASPGFYFEVSPTQGISEAMTALFQRAVADARISR